MSGCGRLDAVELEDFVAGALDGSRAAEVQAHAAGCPRCTTEIRWIEAERRLFAARATDPATPAPPPFAAVLAEVRGERGLRSRMARALRRPSPWLALAAAALVLGVVFAQRDTGPAEAIAERRSSVACYDDTASLVAEAAAYTTDRAVATVEDRYAACLVATPARLCAVAAGPDWAAPASVPRPHDLDVTCRDLRPLDAVVFEEKARGGSLQ